MGAKRKPKNERHLWHHQTCYHNSGNRIGQIFQISMLFGHFPKVKESIFWVQKAKNFALKKVPKNQWKGKKLKFSKNLNEHVEIVYTWNVSGWNDVLL